LHLEFRPDSWEGLIGNEALKKSLQAVGYDKPIMLEGQKGCGKTTIAKIIATEFDTPKENIEEINCFNMKIDEARELQAKWNRTSLFGNKKVFILDEIHGLEARCQQTFLTPLEKLPKNTIVIACTTSTEKMLDTLLRRFVRYRVSTLSHSESKQLVNSILEKQNLNLTKFAKDLLIEKSQGIPGLILTGLPKIIGIEDSEEIKFLLELGSIEASQDTLDLFKMFLSSDFTWNNFSVKLKKIFKTNSPEEIRVGLMNIISGNVMSDFYKPSNKEKLVRLYSSLKDAGRFPEKANLVIALLENCK